jgi:hypothetical protein
MTPEIVILSCFYDDHRSAAELFPRVGKELVARGSTARLVLVDDGSYEARPPGFLSPMPAGFSSVEVVRLCRNGGHQLAIAIGLAYIAEHYRAGLVLVMDADGEDRPQDVPRLLEAAAAQLQPRVVFAARVKRSENLRFRVLYQFYRVLHFLLTGRQIRFGNFSAIPGALLSRIIADPNLRVHYAASVVAARVPYECVPSERGRRLHGGSKLNLVNLVAHGLASITCYNEIVGVRLLCCTLGLALLDVCLIGTVVGIRFFTDYAIPGWATYATGGLLVLLIQSLMLAGVFTFLAISRRTSQNPPLTTYYRSLIHGTECIS